MAEIKRLNYFNSQFLVEKDFQDEQFYHRDMRLRHNRVLHSWGIAEGLVVTKSGDKAVAISPGMALNKDGREMVLPSAPTPAPVDLSTFGSNKDVYVTIAYDEVFDKDDRYQSGTIDNFIRTTERPQLAATTTTPPADGSVVTLTKVHLDGSGNVSTFDNSVRKLATTSELADGSVTEPKLANNAVSTRTIQNNAVTTLKIADNNVTESKLDTATKNKLSQWDNNVTGGGINYGKGNVGIGTTSPTSKLEIAAQDGLAITGFGPFITLRDTSVGGQGARGVLQSLKGDIFFKPESFFSGDGAMVIKTTTGNVGIGTINPRERLEVNGNVRATSFIGDNVVHAWANVADNGSFVGFGCTVQRTGVGTYVITYTRPLVAGSFAPMATCTGGTQAFYVANIGASETSCTVTIVHNSLDKRDKSFFFMLVGRSQ